MTTQRTTNNIRGAFIPNTTSIISRYKKQSNASKWHQFFDKCRLKNSYHEGEHFQVNFNYYYFFVRYSNFAKNPRIFNFFSNIILFNSPSISGGSWEIRNFTFFYRIKNSLLIYLQFIAEKIVSLSLNCCLFRLQTLSVVFSFCSIASAGYLNGGGATDYAPYAHSASIEEYSPVHEAPIHHQQYESIQHIEPVHQNYEHLPIVHSAPAHQQYETIQHIEPVHHQVEHVPVVHSAPQVIKFYQDVPHHHHNEVTHILRIRYNNENKQPFSSLSLFQRLFSS